jgi:lipoprotein-anchoring transpeptidase ErfK/SrfK
VIAGALLLLAGCNEGDAASSASGGSSSTPDAPPAQVAVAPTDGATDVSPVEPLEITITGGELGEVTLVDAAGTPITGTAVPAANTATDPADSSSSSSSAASSSADDDTAAQPVTEVWTPDSQLAWGTTYTLTATAKNADDEEAKAATTFTTVTPDTLSTPSIGPLDGTTVGVGLPIRVYFDDPVSDKAAVESHLQVVSSTPTDGVWSWVNDAEVHFRPSTYWPANTDVTLDANLYGVSFGDGIWGEKNRTVSFHVGAKHVSIADAGAHTLTVYDGDAVVQNFPMSAGSNANPTHNGVHVVTEMNRSMVMDSSTFGLAVDAPGGYRADVEYATRISNNGEFVHAAPWSVGSQGNANVSHGCINLSTDRAAWFFNFSQPGDVVEVKNSVGGNLSRADGDIFDWTIPWDEWQAGSALK